MLIFRNTSDLLRVLDAPPLPRADMVLRFRRWNRLSTAEGESMRYRVLLEIRGIPSHAWSAATAQIILGDACAILEPTPTTVARADLRRFQAAVWCANPDLIPNEAYIRVPEHVDDLGDNNLFLRPEQLLRHDIPLLRYRVEVEILEIHDWNDSSSSDDSGDLPDRILSDSFDDDEYPGFHQAYHSRPLPRRTVFRNPGYGNVSFSSANDVAPPSDDRTLGRSPLLPLRFGRFPPVMVQSAQCNSADAAASILFNSAPYFEAAFRDFDPMILEADGPRNWVCNLEADNGLPPPQAVLNTKPTMDPMLFEVDLLSVPSTPTADTDAGDDATPPQDPQLLAQLSQAEEVISSTPVAMESARFNIQGPDPVICASPSLRNITVARGSRETLPLHVFSEASTQVKETVANFALAACREVPPSVLTASPPRRRSRQRMQPQQGFSIRRSKRLARKSRHHATKPVVQAQNVMMRKLGLTSDTHPPDASSFQHFTDTFTSTLTVSQCDALDALLPAGMGSLALEVASPVLVS